MLQGIFFFLQNIPPPPTHTHTSYGIDRFNLPLACKLERRLRELPLSHYSRRLACSFSNCLIRIPCQFLCLFRDVTKLQVDKPLKELSVVKSLEIVQKRNCF